MTTLKAYRAAIRVADHDSEERIAKMINEWTFPDGWTIVPGYETLDDVTLADDADGAHAQHLAKVRLYTGVAPDYVDDGSINSARYIRDGVEHVRYWNEWLQLNTGHLRVVDGQVLPVDESSAAH